MELDYFIGRDGETYILAWNSHGHYWTVHEVGHLVYLSPVSTWSWR